MAFELGNHHADEVLRGCKSLRVISLCSVRPVLLSFHPGYLVIGENQGGMGTRDGRDLGGERWRKGRSECWDGGYHET